MPCFFNLGFQLCILSYCVVALLHVPESMSVKQSLVKGKRTEIVRVLPGKQLFQSACLHKSMQRFSCYNSMIFSTLKGWTGPLKCFWEQIITSYTKGPGVQGCGGQVHRGFFVLKFWVLCGVPGPGVYCRMWHCLGPSCWMHCCFCRFCAMAPLSQIRGTDGRRSFFMCLM